MCNVRHPFAPAAKVVTRLLHAVALYKWMQLCALANQACGYDDCVPAVLLLHNKPMAGDSTFADYMMDCNHCVHEQSGGMEQQTQRAEA